MTPTVPFGFDIGGSWILVKEQSDLAPDVQKIGRNETARVLRGKIVDPVGSLVFAVQDFPVVVADNMNIEQDNTSMGISYGNGAYQDLVWGKRKRSGGVLRVGWSGEVLVVSSARKRIEGREEWRLDETEQLLSVKVLVKVAKDKLELVRVFRRQ